MTHSTYCDADGVLNFPLYHGTSTYFLERIRDTGLGGRNVIKEWRVQEFFRDVIDACKNIEDADFQKVVKSSEWTLNRILGIDPHNSAGSNWRYGAVYLTADRKKAASYAIRGCGSELLRLSVGWHSDLKRFAPEFAAELFLEYPDIAVAATAAHEPIVVAISGLRVQELATETGLRGDAVADELAFWLEIRELFEADTNSMANSSFEYIGAPIPVSRLHIFDVTAQLEGDFPTNIRFAQKQCPHKRISALDG